MYPMFNVEASSKSYPSGRCAAITNVAWLNKSREFHDGCGNIYFSR
jgi:hypothetical protein